MAQPILPPKPYNPQIDKSVPKQITVHLQRLYPAINDHDLAITLLKQQLDSLGKTVTTVNTMVTTMGGSGSTTILTYPGLGTVNNQTGSTAYTVQGSDNGVLLILDDASPIAVSLNSAIMPPFLIFITNLGTGAATITPTSGNINSSSSFTLDSNFSCMVVPDGPNWWATEMPSGGGVGDFAPVFMCMGG